MKIKNHRKIEYIFYPSKHSTIKTTNIRGWRFKHKKDLINFLQHNIYQTVNGTVAVHINDLSGFYTLREYYVWIKRKNVKGHNYVDIQLKQLNFRGRKFICKYKKIEKSDKRWFVFSDRIFNTMLENKDKWTSNSAKNLIELFKKRGWKDFIPNEEEQEYIDGWIKEGIDFYHWSDRCDYLRCKVIYEYFKKEKLI